MPNNISKILVPIDFSDSSLNALHTAAAFAAQWKADLKILYVHDTLLEFAGVNIITMNSVEKNIESILNALESDIYSRTGIKPGICEEEGFPVQQILKAAFNGKTDLIVMGTHGASGFREGFVGTTALNTVKYAPCPVLLIPEGKQLTAFGQVLFPVRPIPTALRHYSFIRNLLRPQSVVEIFGLRFPGDPVKENTEEEMLRQISKQLLRDNITLKSSWNEQQFLPQLISQHARRKKTDLIILTPSIDVSTKHFFIGPNTHYIINHAAVPLLVINKMNQPNN